MDNGWIKLHRRILRNKLYPNGRPFTKLEAWLDLLLLVNHKEAQVEIKYKTYRINPGESVQSIKTWANRWGWSRKRVQRFFRFLKKEDMIDFVSDQNTTHLTICKWSGYQSKGTSNAHRTHIKRTSEEHHTPTNKKDKNVKNEKEVYTPAFEEFWKLYPKKLGKGKAFEKWKSLKVEKNGLYEKVMASVIREVPLRSARGEVQYVQNPATWLNCSGWEDEPPAETKKGLL